MTVLEPTELALLLDWPGKGPSNGNNIQHPAAYHMLDAAAVGEVLLRPFQLPQPLYEALTFLVALHHLGKISPSFKNMFLHNIPQTHKHWEPTEVLLYACSPRTRG